MDMAIAENLRAEMERAQVTQYALEKLSGVPQPTIQRILKGSDPKASTVNKLAAALHISPSKLLSNDKDISESYPAYQLTSPTNIYRCSASAKKLIARIIAAEANHTSSPQLISALTQMMNAVIPETSNNDYKKLMDEFNEPDS